MDTPTGRLRIVATERGVCKVTFVEDDYRATQTTEENGATSPKAESLHILQLAARELNEYFAGERKDFTVPLDLAGTGFQRAVWERLRQVSFGQITSYGDLARALGSPGASQAVGAANGRNPVAIIVPCHRVVGRDGTLTGYAGGIERKKWLLRHEMATLF